MAGLIAKGALTRARPFRSPHHSASMAALTGGGIRAKPGEVSPGPQRRALPRRTARVQRPGAGFAAPAAGDRRGDGGARQRPHPLSGQGAAGGGAEPLPLRARRPGPRPLRQGPALPERLPGAASPARCSTASTSPSTCRRSPPPTSPCRRRPRAPPRSPPASPRPATSRPGARAKAGEGVAVAQRPRRGRAGWRRIAALDAPGRALLTRAAEAGGLPARGWTRTLRLARTIADLEGAGAVRRIHIAEALIYRRITPSADAVGEMRASTYQL